MSFIISINKFKVHLGVLSLFLVLSLSGFSQDGKNLFKANCAVCHKLDKKSIGPALSGVQDRWENKEDLISWITNSGEYLANNPGDGYAKGLFEDYKKVQMPAQPLSKEEIEAILTYIATPPAEPKQAVVVESATTEAPAEDYTNVWLMAFTVVFLIVVGVLLNVKESLKKLLLEAKGEDGLAAIGEVNDIGLSNKAKVGLWMNNNRKSMIFVAAVGFIVILYMLWVPMLSIGVYTGYAPEQPIKFSHKIHAGDDGIDCVYCHFGAEKGRTSGIPPVNVCMNCHKAIDSGKRWGSDEINKIYAAAGWDADNLEYSKEQNPIEWVKIHNLPDHVYFNHSQHVVVGKLDCIECHGDVATFDYPMHQEAPLTMGWCIECHRTKEVQMEGNPYYDKLHDQLVEKYKEEGLESFTVNQAGGIECAKCHY